jgi:cell division protein FtsB
MKIHFPSLQTLLAAAPSVILTVIGISVIVGTVQAVQQSNTALTERDELRTKLSSLRLEEQRLESLVVYYRTATFQELELRRSLLLAKPNEQVFRLPERHNARRPGDAPISIATKTAPRDSGAGIVRWIAFLRGAL